MSRAASPPGAELLLEIRFVLKRPLVPGSFAAWGITFSQKTDFQEFWDSCAQNKTSEISKNDFQEFWDPCAQNKTSYISMHFQNFWDSLCAEENVGNLKKHALSGIQVTKANSAAWGRTFLVGYPLWGPRFEPKSSQIHPRGLFWTALGARLLFQNRLTKTHFAT